MRKKAENLATHEDIKLLTDQVAAVTKTAKEIEAKISTEVWDRQKQWELKRDVLFEVVKTIGDLSDKLTALHAFYQVHGEAISKGDPSHAEERLERTRSWAQAATELDTSTLLVIMLCSKKLKVVTLEFGVFCRRIVVAFRDGNPDAFMKSMKEFTTKREEVLTAIREELGFNKDS